MFYSSSTSHQLHLQENPSIAIRYQTALDIVGANCLYNTYYKVLNAKNYGIPQNRERIYAISVRKDVDNNPDYDVNNTDNKYYIHFYTFH